MAEAACILRFSARKLLLRQREAADDVIGERRRRTLGSVNEAAYDNLALIGAVLDGPLHVLAALCAFPDSRILPGEA